MSGERSSAHRAQGDPPPASFFQDAAAGGRPGSRRAALSLPGLCVGFDGMDDAWHAAFLSWFGGHAADLVPGMPCTLLLQAARSSTDHFIPPPPPGRIAINPVFVQTDDDPGHAPHRLVRACTYGLAASFSSRGGPGQAVFARTDFEPRERAVENLLRVAVAWLAAARGGLLMHAASIERDGRAFLFFGASGAGKSTLASLSRRGRVISDDLTLVLPGPDGVLEAIGSPFRGTYRGGPPVHGRFPVAAALKLRKGPEEGPCRVEPLSPVTAMAGAVANLPFVVDQLAAAPAIFSLVEAALKSIPIHLLSFHRRDDSFWDAIEAAGLHPAGPPGD
jgi:hypothetical protein